MLHLYCLVKNYNINNIIVNWYLPGIYFSLIVIINYTGYHFYIDYICNFHYVNYFLFATIIENKGNYVLCILTK